MQLILKGSVFDGKEFREKQIVALDSSSGLVQAAGEQGSIETHEDSAKSLAVPNSATILPGLIDSHVHFFGATGSGINEWAAVPDALAVLRSVSDLRKLVRAGFTSVRELGTKAGHLLSKAANEGHFESPRIISCSRALSQSGGDDDPTIYPLDIGQALASYTYFCDGPWDCRRAVRKVVRDGGQVVKVYASGGFAQGGKVRLQFTAEEIGAIVDESHRSGLKVAAHAYGEEALMNAIEAGVDSIEHGMGFTEKAARAMKDRGTFYVPTLIVCAKSKPSANPYREVLIKRHLEEDMELVKKYSIRVAMGSDIVGDATRPHGRNYEEIVLEAKFLGNKEALIAATSNAAECLDLTKAGRIQSGFEADIVVVKGNPIENIESLAPENVLYVIKSGNLVYVA